MGIKSNILWIRMWVKIKQLFYRYNIKQKKKNGEYKSVEELLWNLDNVYKRLPKDEKQIMKNKLQAISDLYNGKEKHK